MFREYLHVCFRGDRFQSYSRDLKGYVISVIYNYVMNRLL